MIDQLIEDIKSDVRDAQDAAAKDVVGEAERISQGPYSLGQLAAMDHPYARRHGKALLPDSFINQQQGTFAASWVAEDGPNGPLVHNTDEPIATFLEKGTRNMLPRPLDELKEFAVEALQKRLAEHCGKPR